MVATWSTRWRREYPDVEVDYQHIDAATIHMVTDPGRFDVIVTDNLFGDIITDLAAAVSGGIGLAASGNIDATRTNPSMFEPVHGSAPDIAGQGIADPTAAIMSVALLLSHVGEADCGGPGRQGRRGTSGHARGRRAVDIRSGRPDSGETVGTGGGFASLTRQCLLFAIGSSFFALATAPGFPGWAGAGAADILCFVGSWFFTTAAWMQLVLCDPASRCERASAAVQFAGTLLFNVSTGAAVWAHA